MSNYDPHKQDTEDLLCQVDALLNDDPARADIDIDEYTPVDAREDQSQIFYQNYSNDYGRQVRNYRNGYGGQRNVEPPAQPSSSIPAYNADFRSRRDRRNDDRASGSRQEPAVDEYRDYGQPDPQQTAPKKKKKRRGCGCATMLILLAVLIAALVGVWMWVFKAPESADSIGKRKDDTATILICGTDADGTRTDTMMLLYLSGSEDKVGLLSLPRDTYTRTSSGSIAKLNSAYGRNGGGGTEEENAAAMEVVLDYVQDIIGYRPDGYILVDMNFVPEIVDLMGGVKVDVQTAIETDGVAVSQGLQQLNGEEALALLRHRKSYATADLGRIEVQRDVIKACLDQWISLGNIGKAMDALSLLNSGSISDLSTRNYLWIAKTVLLNMSGGIATETLPGYADYIGDGSYYILDREAVAEMINRDFNPYEVEIDPDDLNIAQ